MKIEKINDNRIKVTITLNDLEERNIDFESLNYNSPAAQELFWDMMEQAESKFGFTASDSQLCIEALPDADDGFIIMITKLDEENDFESIHKYIKNKYKKSDLKIKKRNRKIFSPLLIYAFNKFDDLYDLSCRINNIYFGDSVLYKYKDIYYLSLTKSNWNVPSPKVIESILSEYSTKVVNITIFEGYLNEYAEKMIETNALEVVGNRV